MSSRNSNSVIALLAGAAVGLGLGILFAPDKGSKTREKMKDGYDDLKDEVKTKFKSIENGTKEKFSDSREELKETIENFLSDTSHKADEAITFLEEKLAELKKQNSKLKK